MLKSEIIKVRVTAETKEKLIQIAETVGTSRSSVVRQMVHITYPHVVKEVVTPTGGYSGS